MTDLDKIKKSALDKLDLLVKTELEYLKDNDKGIDHFSLDEMSFDNFTEDEKKEISLNIKSLKNGGLEFYCQYRGIDINI